MGGSGGGGVFSNRTPEQVVRQVRETVEDVAVKAFEAELGELLGDKLAHANARDTELVSERLKELKSVISSELETAVDTLYGGSVAKHTYVDGLSDVDSLLIIGKDWIGDATPGELIETIANKIDNAGLGVSVRAGKLAVTVTYRDGMDIQLLPATRIDGRLRVPSFRDDRWSSIAPEKFQAALTARNEECGGKLVPTIKLAKAVMGALPEGQQLSGYHTESLAIAAFKGYDGPKTTSVMLPLFFERAKDLVSKPIRDSSGQSVHVDEYLGEENSPQRIAARHVLDRIAKRMRNASALQSREQWEAIFGDRGA